MHHVSSNTMAGAVIGLVLLALLVAWLLDRK